MKLRAHQQRCLDAMRKHRKGQIIVPTGGGKTLCMIRDADRQFNSCNWSVFVKDPDRKTIVVVSPRILLAQQHSEDFLSLLDINPMLQVKPLHVHSGHVSQKCTTDPNEIVKWTEKNYRFNKIIFTTYHSLHRIQESGINVDTIYFDEAHNAVQRHFFPATEFFANVDGIRCYFFTATPKHSTTISDPGMNDEEVFGKVLESVTAPELIVQKHILPARVLVKQLDMIKAGRAPIETDAENLLTTLDDIKIDKVLICVRRVSQIIRMTEETNFCNQLQMRGYNWLYITAKHGGVVNGESVSREQFFETLDRWGKDDGMKFVVLHHSILSEGIDVPGLEATIMMRNMNYIAMSQTIGRVIRRGNKEKTHGLCVVPVSDRVGISTAKKLNAVVDTIFVKGQPAVGIVGR